jgi:hypothetical protein
MENPETLSGTKRSKNRKARKVLSDMTYCTYDDDDVYQYVHVYHVEEEPVDLVYAIQYLQCRTWDEHHDLNFLP